MADMLGVAAGVAGLVGLALEITQITFRYVNGVKRAPASIANYIQELSALTAVMLRLQEVVDSPESHELSGVAPPSFSPQFLEDCRESMEKLKGKLEQRAKHRGLRLRMEWSLWPLEEKETLDLATTFHRYRGILDSVVSMNTLSVCTYLLLSTLLK